MKQDVADLMPEDARRAANEAFPSVVTAGFKCSDLGNAERLVARYRDRIRYCPPRSLWLVWDGKRWTWDETGEVKRLAKATVRGIYAEASAVPEEKEGAESLRKAISKHASDSEKAGRIGAMISLAESEPGIPVLPRQLDADPWALNVANGTIDLRTGRLRPHNRHDLITRVADVKYDPEARSELWEKYLRDATGDDDELSAYLRRAVGYALQGNVTEKCFWFLYGPPDGMKSTFIESVSSALGEYAANAAFTTWLVQSNTGGNRGDLVRLMGTRLVCSVEVRKGARFDEEVMKKVTGGDELTAAAKFEADITFKPNFSLWLAANDAPVIRDDDEGAWSRVRRIPFNHPLPFDQRDPKMREKLRAPEVQSAILAWAVRGCLEWQKSGLGTCKAVEQSSAEYRQDMDRCAGFFADCCEFKPEAKATIRALREAYKDWCHDEDIRLPLSSKDFNEKLEKRGCAQAKKGSIRYWRGVRLLENWEAAAGDNGTSGTADPVRDPSEFLSGGGLGNDVPDVPSVPDDDDADVERVAIQGESANVQG